MLEKPDRRDARHKGGGPPNVVLAAWRNEIGTIQKIFRWLNQSAYLVSIPFIIILLFGIAVKAYAIAIFGADVRGAAQHRPDRRRGRQSGGHSPARRVQHAGSTRNRSAA